MIITLSNLTASPHPSQPQPPIKCHQTSPLLTTMDHQAAPVGAVTELRNRHGVAACCKGLSWKSCCHQAPRRWEKGYLKAPGGREHLISTSGHSVLWVEQCGNSVSSSCQFSLRKRWRALAHGLCTTRLDCSEQDYTSVFPVLQSARASELSPFRPLCNKQISKLACGRKVILYQLNSYDSLSFFYINPFSNLPWNQIPHGFHTEKSQISADCLESEPQTCSRWFPLSPTPQSTSQPCQCAPFRKTQGESKC